MNARFVAAAVALVCAVALPVPWQAAPSAEVDLTELDLAELMDIEVTSVAKRGQPIREAAAAVQIITRDEIERSGARNIPDLLRRVPGMDVAQLNGSTWAVSSRGFNLRFAGKMLVLMDGRSLYTPLFAGTYWDVQDTVLADIERIEVIRGPGETLWGANAVNGVINIITRPADETQGGLVTALAGTERGEAAVRYGGTIGRGHYRVYGKRFSADDQVDATGADVDDGWHMSRGGFRMDWRLDDGNSFTVQGDVYDGRSSAPETFVLTAPPYLEVRQNDQDMSGFNLIGRWRRQLANDSETSLQVYFDKTDRATTRVGEKRDTWDVEFDHRIPLGRHTVIWGLGARTTSDRIRNSDQVIFTPDRSRDDLISGFIQDDVRLAQDRLRLTFGTKIEHNDYSQFEVQPNLRVLWSAKERQAVWAAASRAIRSPTRAFTDVESLRAAFPDPFTPGIPDVVTLFGSVAFEPEELLAYEVGYRVCPRSAWCLDTAAFLNEYDNLTTAESALPFPKSNPPSIVIPLILDNQASGSTYGVELSATRKLARTVRLFGWYSLLRTDIETDPTSTDVGAASTDNSPEHQAFVSLGWSPSELFTFDLSAHYRDEIPDLGIDELTRVDLRLSWSPAPDLNASLVFQNLLDDQRQEFAGDEFAIPSEIERSVYGALDWRF